MSAAAAAAITSAGSSSGPSESAHSTAIIASSPTSTRHRMSPFRESAARSVAPKLVDAWGRGVNRLGRARHPLLDHALLASFRVVRRRGDADGRFTRLWTVLHGRMYKSLHRRGRSADGELLEEETELLIIGG